MSVIKKLIYVPVNRGKSDWVMCAQIWKLDIAVIAEDYTDNIVFVSFKLSSPLPFPVKRNGSAHSVLHQVKLQYK